MRHGQSENLYAEKNDGLDPYPETYLHALSSAWSNSSQSKQIFRCDGGSHSCLEFFLERGRMRFACSK